MYRKHFLSLHHFLTLFCFASSGIGESPKSKDADVKLFCSGDCLVVSCGTKGTGKTWARGLPRFTHTSFVDMLLTVTVTWRLDTMCKARLDRPNDGSRSAGEGLCVLQSFLFATQQEH